MIIDVIIQFLVGGLNLFLGWLPTFTLPTADFLEFAGKIGALAASINNYFPVAALGVCLALVVAVKIGLLFWRVAIFCWELLPFT